MFTDTEKLRYFDRQVPPGKEEGCRQPAGTVLSGAVYCRGRGGSQFDTPQQSFEERGPCLWLGSTYSVEQAMEIVSAVSRKNKEVSYYAVSYDCSADGMKLSVNVPEEGWENVGGVNLLSWYDWDEETETVKEWPVVELESISVPENANLVLQDVCAAGNSILNIQASPQSLRLHNCRIKQKVEGNEGFSISGTTAVSMLDADRAASDGYQIGTLDLFNPNYDLHYDEEKDPGSYIMAIAESDDRIMCVQNGEVVNQLVAVYSDGSLLFDSGVFQTQGSRRCYYGRDADGELGISDHYVLQREWNNRESITAAAPQSMVYIGSPLTPEVVVKDGEYILKEGKEYTGSVVRNFTIQERTDEPSAGVSKGKFYTVLNMKFKVTGTEKNGGTVEFAGLVKKVQRVSIPKNVKIQGGTYKVTSIAKNAFKNNTKLKKIVISANIQTIGASAFAGCKNLKTIQVKTKQLKTVGKKALKGIHKKAVIKVPAAKKKAYSKLLKKKGQSASVKIK